jgi:hypothetical protein
METDCIRKPIEFQDLGRRKVTGNFDGGDISSDGGSLLLREVEKHTHIIEQFAQCFIDHRNQTFVEHPLRDLIAQRVYALALGYEDLNDHDELRGDPMLAVLVGKEDPKGENRQRERDRGKSLAGKSTLNRLELRPADAKPDERYKKIAVDEDALRRFFVEVFIQAHSELPEMIILDLDATDDPLHGKQEGRFFHGYYDEYCYLPLYIFSGEHLLCAKLRTSDIDGAKGSVEEVARIVKQLREPWPDVRIILRADSGFCREELMVWCEGQERVDYIFGIARNSRLLRAIEDELQEAGRIYKETDRSARVFADFMYQTLESWSRERRVVGKAEHLAKGQNPRFVVTTLSPQEYDARALYEDLYCARGEMENRIKEQQNHLFADGTSSGKMRANQLRLWFSSVAYLLMHALRRLGLNGTELEKAQCNTIRLKLLKIGAVIRMTVRRIWISLSESYPYARIFRRVYEKLRAIRAGPVPPYC